jgi:hypothetical protein
MGSNPFPCTSKLLIVEKKEKNILEKSSKNAM